MVCYKTSCFILFLHKFDDFIGSISSSKTSGNDISTSSFRFITWYDWFNDFTSLQLQHGWFQFSEVKLYSGFSKLAFI